MSNDLGTIKVYDSPEAAKEAARKEAEEAGVSPSAVMHSAPDGYGTGDEAFEISEEEVVEVDDEDDDPESMTRDEIKAELDAKGVEYKSSAKKAELVELLENAD